MTDPYTYSLLAGKVELLHALGFRLAIVRQLRESLNELKAEIFGREAA
jgi:hypothetical protein